MPSKKRTSRLEEKLQKQAEKLKSQLEKELAPKRGSGEPLALQCVEEDLSPAQIAWNNKIQAEIKSATKKVDGTIKRNERPGTLIFRGDIVQVLQYTGEYIDDGSGLVLEKPPMNNTIQLVMDSRLVVGAGSAGTPITVTPGTKQVTLATNATLAPPPLTLSTRGTNKKITATTVVPSTTETRGNTRTRNLIETAPPPLTPTSIQPNIRPNELNAVGGLATGKPTTFVDLTTDDGRPAPDSREVSFNKLQGKTYPSLVVVARPYLHSKEAANIQDRGALDAKVKSVLMYTPTKFTEWLIQQGLVKSEQICAMHPGNRLKLGMYTDVSKFAYSGGYVWISDCCPARFVSVFSGSIFEGATHPPSVILKLIYHWACRTNIQNIIQWVNVENIYVKGIFAWLRAVCSAALHTHFKPMGGKNKRIEIGVISLGTTSQDGNKRQVKVEVLGVLDPESRLIRLWAVEPLTEADTRYYKRRFWKILEPLNSWVSTDSIIVTDLTVDKNCLNILGFATVVQSPTSDTMVPGNHAVMDYLRRIVPRMFQNTLSLLSRHIIQQFLDELVWRECFGVTAAQAFNNIVIHLAEQTRQTTQEPLNARLTKISTNPFKFWKNNTEDQTAEKTQPQAQYVPNSTGPLNTTTNQRVKRGIKRTAPINVPVSKVQKRQLNQSVSAVIDLDDDHSGALESYYYGTIDGVEINPKPRIELFIKCCICKSVFNNNIKLLDHLLAHAHNTSTAYTIQCRFCLAMLSNQENLTAHLNESHPRDTFLQNALICVICEARFSSANQLTKHMSMLHVAAELPYECGTCHHRTSSHRAAVEHFYNEHDGSAMLQCPFCLKSISVWNAGRAYSQNVSFFISHLQKHQKKGTAKKCARCALWFVHKGALKEHQLKSHVSLSGKRGLRLWHPTSSKVILARPKDHTKISTSTAPPPVKNRRNDNFDNVTFVIPDGLKCKECDSDITIDGHWPGVQSCPICSYVTCCSFAMQDHSVSCKDSVFGTITPAPLISDMHCVCGYKNNDGNILAKHLAICERKSAYPTVEAAKGAIATHSMLDVLGLVRRAEEPAAKDNEVEIEEFQDSMSAKKEPTETPAAEKPKETEEPKKDAEPVTIVESPNEAPKDPVEGESSEATESNKPMEVEESNDDVTVIPPVVITMTID